MTPGPAVEVADVRRGDTDLIQLKAGALDHVTVGLRQEADTAPLCTNADGERS
jgi:hypothetical protein